VGYRPGIQNERGYEIAARIERLAETKGFTIRRILKECHVNWSTFSRWRDGSTNPFNVTIMRVEAALDRLEHL